MEMDLVGIINQNEYYTNHYFTSIFKENAEDTIKEWKVREKEDGIQLPWKKLRDISRQYYRIRDRYSHIRNEDASKPLVQELAELYLNALGYENRKSVIAEVTDGISVPVYHEETKANGAPLLWAFLCVANERGDDILQGKILAKSDDEEQAGTSVDTCNDDILAKLFFAGEEAPRFVLLFGINQIALIDRNKWNEKRYLQFMMEDIFSRHEESAFMAMTVLLHRESLCPVDGACVLDHLDENSHKNSAAVSDALKYALRECIEILGNEVIYDMKTRQGIDLSEHPVDAAELTLECLRYMYRFLFMLFIEARPELGYAPMKSQTYVQGYSLEGLRDVCERVRESSEVVSEGYYIDDTLKELFHMTYYGYPEGLDDYKKAIEIEKESMHDAFTMEALKAHIFDPEYTKLITNARLRNCAMLQIVDLMSISRSANAKERRGRISYSALGINQMGAVYEALLSYRGFIAEETLFEVKRKGDKFNELEVGYFVPERELDNYEEDERVRYEKGEKKGQLRKYEPGTFIYRLAGREREKSASYYTPEVLTKCLVKYALNELLKDKTADEILHLTICEPAMGSAAFLNEAINQLAEAYLNKKQEECGEQIPFDQRSEKLQEVKMFIADRNVYGVDLNPIAVELGEVSIWLNTIYKGAYVPWFGTQLVCGNSLIGARRQVYYTSKLENGTWYKEAPDRIMPGEKRKKVGVANRVYHFLLGDPSMANYTDKVIKNLEPENIKKINDWRKEFTRKFDEDDIKTVLRLSDTIDVLWEKTVEFRKKVKIQTENKLSVYGYEDNIEGSHLSIRQKDELLHKVYMSEGGENASPYARLKAAMDYWCALWFWPIDKADLLPTRQEFFFEMSLILEGGIAAVSTSSSGQMSLLDSEGKVNFDEEGNIKYSVEGNQLALDFRAQYSDLGIVCLDDLRGRSERLAIANKIAEEQRFMHWELEFADIFDNNGGFDLIIGNPPWIKTTWTEGSLLGEYNPALNIKNYSAKKITEIRDELLKSLVIKFNYFKEYINCSGTQAFLNAPVNYNLLKGVQTNLYKCFLPMSWSIGKTTAIIAFIHPDGVYDDPKGTNLRREIYKKLRFHFQFINEKLLFSEVGHPTIFSLNIYSNIESIGFITISNLFDPITIDQCFMCSEGEVGGIKNKKGEWNLEGHSDRVIYVGNDELELFAKVFDNVKDCYTTRLPSLHTKQLVEICRKIAQLKQVEDFNNEILTSQMLNETGAQEEGVIDRVTFFPNETKALVYSGPHLWVANPIYKTPRRICIEKADYDVVDLNYIDAYYLQRTNYKITDYSNLIRKMPTTPWNTYYNEEYRVAFRRRLNLKQERTLIGAIIPRGTFHTNLVNSICFRDIRKTALFAGLIASLPYDFLIKTLGKGDLYDEGIRKLPFISSKYDNDIILRALLLNCLSLNYLEIWKKCFTKDFTNNKWAKDDIRLSNDKFLSLNEKLDLCDIPKSDYERYQLLVELDVLVSMGLEISLDQLSNLYRIQFPVMQIYEVDTWYDRNGRIVFTNNRGLSGVGLSRPEWEQIKDAKEGVFYQTIEDDTIPGGPVTRTIEYVAPFDRCDREKDYEEVWHNFEKRFGK